MIQTYSPDHYAIELAQKHDYEKFYETEISYRELMHYPPIGHMLMMLAASEDEMTAILSSELLAAKIRQAQEKGKLLGLSMIGPSDAGVAKVKDVYRKVLYFKHQDYSVLIQIKDVLEQFISRHKEFANVMIQFDFDPMNGF